MYMDDDTLTPQAHFGTDPMQRMQGALRPRLSDLPESTPTPSCNGDRTCTPKSGWGLRDYPLASVYAPTQEFRKLYDRDTALRHGTVFEELNLPFMGDTVSKGGCKHD